MICVIHAHPYLSRSRANRVLAEARLLVNAIDDVADSLALTARVREHFPDLPMIARAGNVSHYVTLRTRGVTVAEREELREFFARDRAQFETERRTGWNRD
jgi:glutathione-regulated potassium-efflux system ancillary protein KefC